MVATRQEAHEQVSWVVAGARSGVGGGLLLTGEAGSGKSTLLESAVQRAGDAIVLRVTGVQVERGLSHSALHALLRPVADLVAALPAVQRQAVEVALGLSSAPPPAPFLLGAATLSLLAAAAERTPVLALVDDAQWVDDASLHAVAFAARRLASERIGVLVAARSAEVPEALAGLPVCALTDVTAQEAAALLDGLDVSPAVAAELVAATRGNLLALVETARALDREQRVGQAPLPPAAGAGALFQTRARALPESARRAGALAALAEDLGAPVLAAARTALGLEAAQLRPAEQAGLLVASADGVRWRHPLAREAVLETVDGQERRMLARALATAAADAGLPEALVVELLVAATDAPDERLAAALGRAAQGASASGDHARAARLWSRAAEIGTDPGARPVRLLETAESLLRAGRLRAAAAAYDVALSSGLDAEGQARAHLARGRIEHLAGSPRRAVDSFRAAAAVAPTGGVRTRACAEGVLAAMYAALPDVARSLGQQAEAAHDPSQPAERVLALHAQGAALCVAGQADQGRPLLVSAVEDAVRSRVLEEQGDLLLWVVTAPLFAGGDPDHGASVVAPALERLRLRGDLLWLPRVLRLWGVRHLVAGRTQAAYAVFEEAVELSRAAEQTTQLLEALAALAEVEALRGEREPCLTHVAELEVLLAGLDVPFLAGVASSARGLLHLGLGEPAAAAEALGTALSLRRGQGAAETAADLVEALVLDGRPDDARAVLEAMPSARAAALLDDDDERSVAALLRAATGPDADHLETARCQLLAGERLRRSGSRREAREHLRAAAEAFGRAGAAPWRQRAEKGLRASGEVLAAAYDVDAQLTGAELRVAELVAEGRPTREVAALLFLSPKTVEFHLGRIYRKLGVRGRAELARRLADTGTFPAPS